MGIKETRQRLFNTWEMAILQEEWGKCDSIMTLILHTLPDDKPGRKELEDITNRIQTEYLNEGKKLQILLQKLKNSPFRKEQLKAETTTKLSYWRANEMHNAFVRICKINGYITEEEQTTIGESKHQIL